MSLPEQSVMSKTSYRHFAKVLQSKSRGKLFTLFLFVYYLPKAFLVCSIRILLNFSVTRRSMFRALNLLTLPSVAELLVGERPNTENTLITRRNKIMKTACTIFQLTQKWINGNKYRHGRWITNPTTKEIIAIRNWQINENRFCLTYASQNVGRNKKCDWKYLNGYKVSQLPDVLKLIQASKC